MVRYPRSSPGLVEGTEGRFISIVNSDAYCKYLVTWYRLDEVILRRLCGGVDQAC